MLACTRVGASLGNEKLAADNTFGTPSALHLHNVPGNGTRAKLRYSLAVDYIVSRITLGIANASGR